MIRRFLHILLIISISLYTQVLNAQPKYYDVDVLSANEGISGLEIYKMFMDSKDRLWIKTDLALNLVSGNNVLLFKNTKHGIHSKNSVQTFTNSNNSVNIFYKGISSFYDKYNEETKSIDSIKLTTAFPADSLIDFSVYERIQDDTFIIKQLFRIDGKYIIYDPIIDTKTILKFESNIKLQKTIQRIKVTTNNIWLIDKNNIIYKYKHNGDFLYTVPSPKELIKSSSKQISFIFDEDHDHNLWISYPGYNGIFHIKNGDKTSLKHQNLPQDKLYVFLWRDKTKKLLFATSNKLFFINDYYIIDENKKVSNWNDLVDFSYFPTQVMSEDFYNNMFLGSYRGIQLIKFPPSFLKSYDVKETQNIAGSYGNLNRGIIETINEDIYIIRENDFIYKYPKGDKTRKTIYSPNKKTVHQLSKYYPSIEKIFVLSNSNNIINHFINEIDTKTDKVKKINLNYIVNNFELLNSKHLLIYAQDKNKSPFLLTYNIKNNKIVNKTELKYFKSLKDHKTKQILYDKNNNRLWIIYLNLGIFYIDLNKTNKQIKQLHFLDKKENNAYHYLDISFGNNNTLIVSTDNGFYIIDTKNGAIKTHISKKDGIESNTVYATILQQENIWFSTALGLNVFNQVSGNIQSFYFSDGLPDSEFNNRIKQITPSGKICFGNSNGGIIINPKYYNSKQEGHNIYLRDVVLSERDAKQKIYLQHNDTINLDLSQFKNVLFSLRHSDWKSRNDYKFSFKLEGINNDFLPSESHNIKIEKLNLGINKLTISGKSKRNIRSSNNIVIYIKTHLPFYKKDWFKYLLFALLIVLIIYIFNIKSIATKNQQENQKLQYQKRISQLELMALQSQMNPHFIFNAISAIQDYLWDNDKEAVESYLNDFSKLMRFYLESSRTKTITLNREMQMLKLYSRLERLRFNNKFELTIHIEKDIEPTYIKLPTMLLQPFVENAINHGIFHKDGNGIIDIHITSVNNNLKIEIEDDGIGRVKAKELKEKSIHNYKSRAIQITEERLDVLKEFENIEIRIEIEDLYNENDDATGTKVTIIIPEEI